jgi:excisionase family DNA binding protein
MFQTGTREFLTPQELADRLIVPLATIYGWRHQGHGPKAYRVGKHLRFAVKDVDAWLAERADGEPVSGGDG